MPVQESVCLRSTNPLIVLQGGKPVLASVAIGMGLHNVTFENLLNVLDFGMDPQTAINQPDTQGPFLEHRIHPSATQ